MELDDTPTLEDYQENKKIMNQEVEKLRLIVEDLLQLNSGKQLTFKDTISLTNVLDKIKKELEQSRKINKVKINFEIVDLVLYGSQNLIHRALFNLIENAIKYNEPEGVVRVYTTLDEALFIGMYVGIVFYGKQISM